MQTKRVTVVNVFADAASRLPRAYYSHTTSAEAAVISKMSFERFTADHRVRVKHYHADNGVYKTNLWLNHCSAQGQTSSFCGVSVHHQNPIAESLNRRATEMARTLLLTTQLHWDNVSDTLSFDITDYWPFAIEYAFNLLAKLPLRNQSYTPFDVFTRQKNNLDLGNFHTWGCPVYVLDPRLASGKKIPRWQPRSKKGLYLGFSRSHASNVALVLNLSTMRISPQFHVVFDYAIATVDPNTFEIAKEWEHLYATNREIYADPADKDLLESLPYDWPMTVETSDHTHQPDNVELSGLQETSNETQEDKKAKSQFISESSPIIQPRRSSRRNKGQTTKFPDYDVFACELHMKTAELLSQIHQRVNSDHPRALLCDYPTDMPSLKQAMRQEDANKWIEAMKQEIEQLENHNTWTEQSSTLLTPKDTILDSLWVLKKKRRPDGSLLKYKARLCVRGDQQIQGDSFWEVYAPVVGGPCDNSLELKQEGSISKLISMLGLHDDSKSCSTPAAKVTQPAKSSNRQQFSWKYSSVVGLLLWISGNTRPDISYAVSMAARHMENLELDHYKAVYRIGRYLLGTRDRGLILRPDLKDAQFEIFVGADFAGGYSGEVALSTTGSEYIALSHSLRDALPTQSVLSELASIFFFSSPELLMRCDLYEDNAGAVELASNPKYRPRTKHIAVKYHHVKERVHKGEVKVRKISTHLQKADLLTKELDSTTFRRLRALTMGW
eukprot:IDg7750t1